MQLSVSDNVKEVQAMLGQFQKEVQQAAVSSLNKTAEQMRTQISRRIRSIRKVRGLKAAGLKEGLKLHHASRSRMTAAVVVPANRIPLNQYQSEARKSGVWADVVGQGMKGPVRKFGNKAFTNPKLGGGNAFFVRTTSKHLPIKKLFGPSLASAVRKDNWWNDVLKPWAAETWARVFVNQIQWRLRRYMK